MGLTIGKLVAIKASGDRDCDAIIKASYYTTKFVLQLVKLASITKRSSKRSTWRNKSRRQYD